MLFSRSELILLKLMLPSAFYIVICISYISSISLMGLSIVAENEY